MSDLPAPPDATHIGAVLAEYAAILADQRDAAEIVEALARACMALLPVHGIGVLLRTSEGGLTVGTANTSAGRAVEELEVQLREGPCTRAMTTGEQVFEPDLRAAEARYPRFVPQALEAGVAGIHALPLAHRAEPLGALDIVTRAPQRLSRSDLTSAQLLADVTVSFLVASRALEDATTLARQLQHALDSRVVIEQAKGMLAERHDVDVEAAFERLRDFARSRGSTLRSVAEEVLRGDVEL